MGLLFETYVTLWGIANVVAIFELILAAVWPALRSQYHILLRQHEPATNFHRLSQPETENAKLN